MPGAGVDELQAEYGTPEENPEFWASISANTFVDELPGPIQLHHGTADGSVPLLFSELLRDDIEAAGGSPSCSATQATTTTYVLPYSHGALRWRSLTRF
ncbi:MAG: hypothetical protein R2854_01445 [Caldilineaceae bacterium]